MTREEAIDRLKEARAGHKEFLSVETLNMAIKALEQQPKIKMLDSNEVARRLGAIDIYSAREWLIFLKKLEYLGLEICEVEK